MWGLESCARSLRNVFPHWCWRISLAKAEQDYALAEFLKGSPRMIYSSTVVNGPLLAQLRSLGVKIVTHAHELQKSIERWAPGEIMAATLKHSDFFLAGSAKVAENLSASHGVPKDQLDVVYDFIEPWGEDQEPNAAAKAAMREELGIGVGDVVVFGCGTTDWRKGPDLFVEIARLGMLPRYAIEICMDRRRSGPIHGEGAQCGAGRARPFRRQPQRNRAATTIRAISFCFPRARILARWLRSKQRMPGCPSSALPAPGIFLVLSAKNAGSWCRMKMCGRRRKPSCGSLATPSCAAPRERKGEGARWNGTAAPAPPCRSKPCSIVWRQSRNRRPHEQSPQKGVARQRHRPELQSRKIFAGTAAFHRRADLPEHGNHPAG